MKIGIRLHDTAPGTLEERLSAAGRQGFCCAHLALSKVMPAFSMQDAPRLMDNALADRVRGAFSAEGMECAVLGCYLTLAAREDGERARVREIYGAHLRFCRQIGARLVGTETPAEKAVPWTEACRSEEMLAFFIDCLRPVVRLAEENDTVIAIEPVYRHIVSTPERAQRVLEAIPSDHLRIILDAVNLLSRPTVERAEDIVEDALSRLGEKVSVLHLKDYALMSGQTDLRSIACGTGSMRYERLLAFGKARDLPMTLENTTPENAEEARKHLESIAAGL